MGATRPRSEIMTSQLDIKKLKTLETISVSGLPDNPVMPEDKALSSILQAINGSLSTLTEFVLATKEPKEKRVTAISAVLELQAKLNDLSRLYTANVMRKRNNEDIVCCSEDNDSRGGWHMQRSPALRASSKFSR